MITMLERCWRRLYYQWPTKNMIKQTSSAVFLSIVASLVLTTPAHAGDIIATIGSYDSPDGYDFVTTSPPTTYQLIGTFAFTIPTGESATNITISGSFGNGDGTTTALSDYYLGFGGDEEAVVVANCDSTSANCYSGQEGPYNWSATLTQAEIADLAPALAAGSIDFGYTWDSTTPPFSDPLSPTGYDDQYVYAGAATLDITPSPEPATVLFCFSGLAGLAAFRRFRKL
jgi:hypothetical protein